MFKLYCRDERRYTEQIRMIFQETGMRVQEVPVSAADEDQMRKKGELMFQRLPKLVTPEGLDLFETTAIVEHVAIAADAADAGRGNTYLGDNEVERSLARSLCASSNELRKQLYEQYVDDGPKQDQDTFKNVTLKQWLVNLDRQAAATAGDDLGLGPGKSFTFGDIAIFEAINQLCDAFPGDDLLDKYRDLQAYYNTVAKRARFRMYLDNRPARSL